MIFYMGTQKLIYIEREKEGRRERRKEKKGYLTLW